MNEVQRQYKKQLNRILRLKLSRQHKIQMLQSFHQLLKQHYQIQAIVFNQSFNQISMVKSSQKPIEIQSTKFSQSLSIDNVTLISEQDIEQLEQHILSKKILKIQNYETFEALEQELYATEDMVECKRKYNEYLRKQIDKKMLVIQEEKQKSMEIVSRASSLQKPRSKHNKSFSDYFKSWWH